MSVHHSNPCPKCGRTEIHKLCSEVEPKRVEMKTFNEWYSQADTFNGSYDAAEAAWNACAAEYRAELARERASAAALLGQIAQELDRRSFPMTPHDTAEGCVTMMDVQEVFAATITTDQASALAEHDQKARRDEAEQMYFILVLTDASEEYRLAEARKRMAENGSPQWAP